MGTILIDKLLSACVKQGASDLHITVGQPPVLRLHGRMQKLKTKVLEPDDTVALMKSITPDRCQQEFQESGSCDFGFSFGDACRFRVSVFRQRGNIAMVLRQIPVKMWTMDELNVPQVFKSLIARPRGLVIVTGPTGSGKTTSLAAMVDYLNDNFDHHIITIEDPIEFQHQHKKSTVNQREVGVDVTSFKEALRRALRQDPDVILVGEMRDLETIEAAITAAETGHIVFGTLHTNSAAKTVDRIVYAFPANMKDMIRTQLSSSLVAVISQVLCKKTGGGRIAGYEIMVNTTSIGSLIRENKTFRISSDIQTGAALGMITLDTHLMSLVNRELVSPDEALDKAQDPNVMREKFLQLGMKLREL